MSGSKRKIYEYKLKYMILVSNYHLALLDVTSFGSDDFFRRRLQCRPEFYVEKIMIVEKGQ